MEVLILNYLALVVVSKTLVAAATWFASAGKVDQTS